jgi:UDP-glucose 4-epimerase
MRVLVTGAAGKMGRLVCRALLAEGHAVIGLDRRPWPSAPEGVEMHTVDLGKRPAEDVFRSRHPDSVIHMATITQLKARTEERYRVNLGGTRVVFEHASRYGVGQVIFVGRHTFYGAAADSPLYHSEDEPPMALGTFPELADLVAADLFAGSALWRFPAIDTAVLRICYTLGPERHGTLAAFLRGPRVPTVLGFDPLFQFIHEQDAARAIGAALRARPRGLFNVAGPQPLPLSVIVRKAGRQHVPIPEGLMRALLGRFGFPDLPQGAVTHLKYPVVVDATAFTRATGFQHRHDEHQTIDEYRAGPSAIVR